MLHELISHVKTNERVGVEINTVLGGKLSSYKNVIRIACGYFFGDKTRFACSALRRENHIEFINHSKAQLLSKVKVTLDTYGNVLKQKINFTDACAGINMEDQMITATVSCIYCDENDPAKRIKLSSTREPLIQFIGFYPI